MAVAQSTHHLLLQCDHYWFHYPVDAGQFPGMGYLKMMSPQNEDSLIAGDIGKTYKFREVFSVLYHNVLN